MRRAGFPATGLLELQSDVLHKIVRLETRTRDLRTKRALNKKRLSGSFGARLSKAEAAEVKRSVARDEAGINVCQSLLRLTRSIADGLAFSVLPKWDIKPLSFKETAGFISGKQGLPLELRILRELLRKGEIALLNDITNCLRYGDITVPRMPSPAIIEVKSGSAENSRARRQMAKAEEIAAYLSTDVSNNWQGTGWTVTRRSLAQSERHHRRRLVNLVRNAINRGAAISWPEPSLCYMSLCSKSVTDVLNTELPKFREAPFAYPLFPAQEHPNYYYPLTLSITDSDAWWAVVSGEVSLVVLIDPGRVKALGRAQRLNVEQLYGFEWQWTVSSTDALGDLGPLQVSRQFFGRVAGEFLSLRWLMEEVGARFQQGPGRALQSDDTKQVEQVVAGEHRRTTATFT